MVGGKSGSHTTLLQPYARVHWCSATIRRTLDMRAHTGNASGIALDALHPTAAGLAVDRWRTASSRSPRRANQCTGKFTSLLALPHASDHRTAPGRHKTERPSTLNDFGLRTIMIYFDNISLQPHGKNPWGCNFLTGRASIIL